MELLLLDLMMRIGPEANVTEWTALASSRMEAGAARYADLAMSYTRTQLAILSPAPPRLPPPDLSWVSDDLDRWLPAPMIEVAGRAGAGEDIREVLVEIRPKLRREVSAFVNEVEARTVNEALDDVEDFLVFDDQRPTAAELADLEAGITAAEQYANAGYPVHKVNGQKMQIMILPQIGACGFCVTRADQLYSHAVLHGKRIRSHTACRCDWRYVTQTEANTFEPVLGGGR